MTHGLTAVQNGSRPRRCFKWGAMPSWASGARHGAQRMKRFSLFGLLFQLDSLEFLALASKFRRCFTKDWNATSRRACRAANDFQACSSSQWLPRSKGIQVGVSCWAKLTMFKLLQWLQRQSTEIDMRFSTNSSNITWGSGYVLSIKSWAALGFFWARRRDADAQRQVNKTRAPENIFTGARSRNANRSNKWTQWTLLKLPTEALPRLDCGCVSFHCLPRWGPSLEPWHMAGQTLPVSSMGFASTCDVPIFLVQCQVSHGFVITSAQNAFLADIQKAKGLGQERLLPCRQHTKWLGRDWWFAQVQLRAILVIMETGRIQYENRMIFPEVSQLGSPRLVPFDGMSSEFLRQTANGSHRGRRLWWVSDVPGYVARLKSSGTKMCSRTWGQATVWNSGNFR